MNSRIWLRVAITVFLLSPCVMDAATTSERDRLKICATYAPLGFGTVHAGPTSRASASAGWKGHWFTLCGSWTQGNYNVKSFLTGQPVEKLHQEFSDFGLLYGRRLTEGRAGYLYAGAGIARVRNKKSGQYLRMVSSYPARYEWTPIKEERGEAWGMPVLFQAVVKPASWLGFNLDLFADFSRKGSFGGVAIGVLLGK